MLVSIVRQLAQKRVGTDGEVALVSLQQQVDLSGIAAQGLTYNIDLNAAGHEYDSLIANGLKVAAGAALVAVTAGLAAPAAGAAATPGGECHRYNCSQPSFSAACPCRRHSRQ